VVVQLLLAIEVHSAQITKRTLLHGSPSNSSVVKRARESYVPTSCKHSPKKWRSLSRHLVKSSVELKTYYARAHRARCWLFADWLAHGAPRAFPSRKRPHKNSCSAAIRPTEHVIVHLLLTIEVHQAHVTKRSRLHGSPSISPVVIRFT